VPLLLLLIAVLLLLLLHQLLLVRDHKQGPTVASIASHIDHNRKITLEGNAWCDPV
jgi:hypothetical protein